MYCQTQVAFVGLVLQHLLSCAERMRAELHNELIRVCVDLFFTQISCLTQFPYKELYWYR